MEGLGSFIQGAISLLMTLGFYVIPSIIANARSHNNFRSILILNIFLGWTGLGWILCLAWSFSNDIRMPSLGEDPAGRARLEKERAARDASEQGQRDDS